MLGGGGGGGGERERGGQHFWLRLISYSLGGGGLGATPPYFRDLRQPLMQSEAKNLDWAAQHLFYWLGAEAGILHEEIFSSFRV